MGTSRSTACDSPSTVSSQGHVREPALLRGRPHRLRLEPTRARRRDDHRSPLREVDRGGRVPRADDARVGRGAGRFPRAIPHKVPTALDAAATDYAGEISVFMGLRSGSGGWTRTNDLRLMKPPL